jgi:hypothetical protein
VAEERHRADVERALRQVALGVHWFLEHRAHITPLSDRDPQVLLKQLNNVLRDPESEAILYGERGTVRSLAFELKDARNHLAHYEPFDEERTFRAISSAWRLLDGLGCPSAPEARHHVDTYIDGMKRSSTTDEIAHATLVGDPAVEDTLRDDVAEEDLQELDFDDEAFDEITDESPDPEPLPSTEELLAELDERWMNATVIDSVGTLMAVIHGVELTPSGAFAEPIWSYQGVSDVSCPRCGTHLVVCREGERTEHQRDARPWAVVCLGCRTVRRMLSYDYPTRVALRSWAQVDR